MDRGRPTCFSKKGERCRETCTAPTKRVWSNETMFVKNQLSLTSPATESPQFFHDFPDVRDERDSTIPRLTDRNSRSDSKRQVCGKNSVHVYKSGCKHCRHLERFDTVDDAAGNGDFQFPRVHTFAFVTGSTFRRHLLYRDVDVS